MNKFLAPMVLWSLATADQDCSSGSREEPDSFLQVEKKEAVDKEFCTFLFHAEDFREAGADLDLLEDSFISHCSKRSSLERCSKVASLAAGPWKVQLSAESCDLLKKSAQTDDTDGVHVEALVEDDHEETAVRSDDDDVELLEELVEDDGGEGSEQLPPGWVSPLTIRRRCNHPNCEPGCERRRWSCRHRRRVPPTPAPVSPTPSPTLSTCRCAQLHASWNWCASQPENWRPDGGVACGARPSCPRSSRCVRGNR